METIIIVARGENGATTTDKAILVALKKAPENYGLKSIVGTGRQWKATFEKVR